MDGFLCSFKTFIYKTFKTDQQLQTVLVFWTVLETQSDECTKKDLFKFFFKWSQCRFSKTCYSCVSFTCDSRCRWVWRHIRVEPAAVWRSPRDRVRWRTSAPWILRRPGYWRRPRKPAGPEPYPSCRDWPPASAPSDQPDAAQTDNSNVYFLFMS